MTRILICCSFFFIKISLPIFTTLSLTFNDSFLFSKISLLTELDSLYSLHDHFTFSIINLGFKWFNLFFSISIIPDKFLTLLFESKFSASVFPIFILKKKNNNNKKNFYIKLNVSVAVDNLLLILFILSYCFLSI